MKLIILLLCLTSNCFAYDCYYGSTFDNTIRLYPDSYKSENPIRHYDYPKKDYGIWNDLFNPKKKCTEPDVLKYNWRMDSYSYEAPELRLRYNPMENRWEYSK